MLLIKTALTAYMAVIADIFEPDEFKFIQKSKAWAFLEFSRSAF
jgi:hypothetical protein